MKINRPFNTDDKIISQKKQTSKLIKLVGTETLYKRDESGKLVQVKTGIYAEIMERDTNFMKMFYENFINVLESYFAGSSFKVRVLKLLLKNADKENCIFATSAEMARALNTTTPAVLKELKALQNCNFIKKIKNGVYQINADCLFKGSHTQRIKTKEKFSKPLEV